jgi:hypothetical protein
MSKLTSKSALNFLDSPHRDLGAIFSKVKRLKEINRAVMKYLDANIAPYCQVANKMNKKLTLITANGSVATQLRFQAPDLLRAFKQDPDLNDIIEIQCKVQPLNEPSEPAVKKRKVKPLSQDAAKAIRETAEAIEDPRLKEIMLRIAKNT